MRSTIIWKVTFEGLNLTDTFNQQFTDTDRDSILVNSHTGRQFYLGRAVRVLTGSAALASPMGRALFWDQGWTGCSDGVI